MGKAANLDFLRPRPHALALEPRVMFDGAAATAATDPHHQGDSAKAPEAPAAADRTTASATRTEAAVPSSIAGAPAAPAAPSIPAHSLLVVDSRVEQQEMLSGQAGPGVSVLVVNANEDGLAAISAALASLGQVDSIQILSHGAAGTFTLGNRTISSDNIGQLAGQLQGWSAELTADADIQLYGCSIGAGPAGQTLVNELARLTGADVGASSDATGSAADGGNWTLETRAGDVDKALALSAAAVESFRGLLDDASPKVTLSSGGSDVLLGDTFTFTASFTNDSTQVGYAPYIDLFVPSTGKDGDDGVTFQVNGATFQGVAIRTYDIVFDANGQATHPLAKGTDGQPLIINAATYGLRAGDHLVVLQLPNASIVKGQPAVDIVVTMKLSNLADTSLTDGAPDLTIKARGGFQFGNTSADDPSIDPTLIEAGTHNFIVHPTMVELTMTDNIEDGQTASGPNYERSITITASTASDQTLTNVVIEQDLPDTIIVNSIVPGANGAVTSITLQDGTVITDAGAIASTLAAGAYLSHFEVTYSTLTGSQSTTVNFYVPDVDANGQQILDPTTGAPRTINIPATDASAQWVPLDPRDIPLNPDAALSGTGEPISFEVVSMVVYKPDPVVTTDVGNAGPSPGDILTYTLNVDISDYFAFGRNVVNNGVLQISDQATDGQTLVAGSGTLKVFIGGQEFDMVITPTVSVDPVTGVTSMTLDIAQTLRDNGQALAALVGDLAFDDVINGATKAIITYQMRVGQFFGTPSGTDAINEGDTIGNNAVISGTVLVDPITTGGTVSDGDSTSVTIPPSNVDIQLLIVDGTDVSQDPAVELRPGDVVTFQLSYDLMTGDYQSFDLRAYLPLPLFDVDGITWTQAANGTNPAVNQWSYGPGHTLDDTVVPGGVVGVVDGNYIVFDFGDHSTLSQDGSRVELRFTMVVGDQPFGDQRKVTVIGQSNQVTTIGLKPITSQDAVVVDSIAEPVLTISHGVVSSSSPDAAITGTTGTWAPPGTTTNPFTTPLTDITNVNGDVSGIDGGDLLRMATAIENSGGGGAFDVTTSITLPAGLSFANGDLASSLRVYRGDGTLMVAGTDYSVSGNTVTFLDPVEAQASLPGGRSGSAADNSGANLVVLLYDVKVDDAIAASSTLQSAGVLTKYAALKGGEDFVPDGADITDKAGEQVAAPTVKVVFADGAVDNTDSSSASTTGANLVVGETMLYDIVVTLPEGSTNNLRIDDLIPPGMALDTSFAGGAGYEIITLAGAGAGHSGALSADFGGTLTGVAPTGIDGGTVGEDGVGARLSFTASTNNADNASGNNSFVVRVRLVASNTPDNQAGRVVNNNVQLVYSDPDADQAGGTTPLDRTVANSGGNLSVTVAEPTLTITQSTTQTGSSLGVNENDTVTYTITISNNSGVDAYDINFADSFPTTMLTGLTLQGVTYTGSVTTAGGSATDFVLGGDGVLRTADGANIDIGNGGSITIVVKGTVTAAAVNFQTIDNTSNVQWTSIDGAAPVTSAGGERTGVQGLLNGGQLNDYQVQADTHVKVLSGVQVSRIGGMPDTPSADNGTTTDGAVEQVAVGEIVRYRVVSAAGEGVTGSYRVQVTLDAGLEFQRDGTIRIALVSNGGLTSSYVDLSMDDLAVDGNRSSPIALPIPVSADNGPTAVMNLDHVSVTTVDGRTVVTFDLGTITNADVDQDPTDLEGVVIEFNARVSNVASNQSGATLGVTAAMLAPDNSIGARDTVSEQVIEPSFTGMVKQVDSFTPNAGANTSTADISVSFTQNGTGPAYDVTLDDPIFSGASYTLSSVTVVHADGSIEEILPADFAAKGITDNSDANGIHLSVAKVDVGSKVVVKYSVTVDADTAYASTDAVLKWSSLPESFTSWSGTSVGGDATASGERDGSGGSGQLNDYILTEGAGLGLIRGNLWDDSLSPDASDLTPDGAPFAGQTVTLRWAGADGLLDTGDDKFFTTVTDSAGFFHFSGLAAGSYRVEAPASIGLPQPTGEVRVRLDTNDGDALGLVTATVGEGATERGDFAYVEINDAPTNNNVPGPQSVDEDTELNIPAFTVGDVDLDQGPAPGVLDVTLAVLNGVLNYGAAVPAGLSLHEGEGTATIHLVGTADAINQILATLTYKGNLNYNGPDTLTITTKDGGSFGDADGDGIPGEPDADQLQDIDTVAINVIPVNDPPQGVDDETLATEAGGTNNGTPGVNPTLNLLDNDTDVDIATNGDVLHLVSVTGVGDATPVTDGTTEFAVAGKYGTLYVRANGSARYEVNNENAEVQALRTSGQTLSEDFSYVLADAVGAQSSAVLTVTIQGANDTPVGMDDTGLPVNAAAPGTPGLDTSGNVLDADGNGSVTDTDVDGGQGDPIDYGETHTVTGVRNVPKDQAGAVTPVAGGPVTVQGTYGELTINPDGSYTYTVDNDRPATIALAGGQQVQEVFSYQVTDLGGLNSLANLTITVIGSNEAPVAGDDAATAVEAGGLDNGTAGTNPSGNVLTNDTDADVSPTTGQPEALTVTAVRAGQESGSGAAGTVGQALQGQYGTLTLNADGSYTYVVNNADPAVQALRQAGDTLQDFFTYTASDPSGAGDQATLAITIQGANDTPVAQNDTGSAIEAGGVNNSDAGTPATGNVLANDADVDGAAYGETKAVQSYVQGGDSAAVGDALPGAYGSLTIAADGSYTYTVDENNPDVQALRTLTDTLTEVFTYTMVDTAGATSTATLTITIHGRDDTPVANPDTGDATEAGGLNNGTAGSPAVGNVLSNDTDVDDPDLGETKAVQGYSLGGDSATAGNALAGAYGSLTIGAGGAYVYTVDNGNAAVQALRQPTDTLTEVFTYTMVDASGNASTSTLTITIHGANDTPVATNDTGSAIEAGGVNNGTAGTPATGNVLDGDANGGVADTDVDGGANDPVDYGETKAVQGYVQGGNSATAGNALPGAYGSLVINANGSYTYTVDENNPDVQALREDTDTLTEVFTYTMVDAAGATSTATLTITIHGRDDTPVANPDTGDATEAGGLNNGTAGSPASGNVLANDTDVDDPGAGRVSAFDLGGTAGIVGTAFDATYGTLTLNQDGSYTYVVDDTDPAVQALRQSTDTLVEVFNYTMVDPAGVASTSTLTITIHGANDTPVATNDTGSAIEAGGVNNGTVGTPATGNVLDGDANGGVPDTDVDGGSGDPVDYGETKAVQGYAQGGNSVAAGSALAGAYGSLVINADGSYTYTVDENNATVQALRVDTDTLTEVFNYTIVDTAGATSTATLTITIHGRNDAPVAQDNTNFAAAGSIRDPDQAIDAVGNVLPNDSDVDANDTKTLTQIGKGAESTSPTLTDVTGADQQVAGDHGTLFINADGSYTYKVNLLDPLVQALQPGQSLDDFFTYRVTDTEGLSDLATLRIVVIGRDNPPLTVPDRGNAVEQGGVDNTTPGVNPSGNVLANDLDADGDTLTVVGIRTGAPSGTGTDGTVGQVLQGQYGTLTINADGSYTYVLNNDLPEVQALRVTGQTLEESFTYTAADPYRETDTGLLRIVIDGRNDNPVATADTGSAVEAGGLDNGTAGSPATGNVLDNDTDVDGTAYGETKAVQAFDQAGTAGTVGAAFTAKYGTLTLNADGSYTYVVDDGNAEVQALRTALDRLTEVFNYTVVDAAGATSTTTLTITIHGRNDTPVANDDGAVAVEAGGVNNTTPGQDGTGNVLDNDTDVDSAANGETKTVVTFANVDTGGQGAAGGIVAGLYGQLIINADGSFRYVVDNNNPTVQALRTNGETLTESFSYLMRDTQGATSSAHLVIVVHGADDNPVARDDSNVATDQIVAPQAGGNVLPNDSDVDGGDALHVSAIRTGAEAGSGTAGQIDQPLAGRYGTLVIHADGSYTYSIDMTNPEVLAAAGFGQVLHDVFTYTLSDRAGATDLAQLTISLDISAPRIDNGDPLYFDRLLHPREPHGTELGFEPGLFVQPVVRQNALIDTVERASSDGTRIGWVIDRGLLGSPSIGAGLGQVAGQFVSEVVRENQLAQQLELARLAGRHGRVSLTADGLLADPSLFSFTDAGLTKGEAQRPGLDVPAASPRQGSDGAPRGDARPPAPQARMTAPGFTEQLRRAAEELLS